MYKIKCIIVEDEPLAAKVLKNYIQQIQFLELTGMFKNAISANEFIIHNKPDLIFLDIHLPKLKGMAFLKALNDPPEVIITTAYHQYAVEGFDLNVTDYLLKPIEFDRFLTAVNKVKQKINLDSKEKEGKDYIFLSIQKKKVKIPYSELLYIESQREYIKLVTEKKNYLVKMSTNQIEQILPGNKFKRIHRSFIVSLSKIESFNAEMVEIKGISIPIGREYKQYLDNL